jgi:hypothetical protein
VLPAASIIVAIASCTLTLLITPLFSISVAWH